MTEKGEKYECPICNKIVEIVEEGSTVPVCCDQEMQLIEEAQIKEKDIDKNICGMVVKCDRCGLKLRILKDGMGSLTHCIEEMMLAKSEDIETGSIYKCKSCGQITKIQKSGCGEFHCCDEELCIMNVPEVKELEKRVTITIDASKDKPYEHKFFICKTCGREVMVMEHGRGDLICHGTKMDETPRIGFYFQGGG